MSQSTLEEYYAHVKHFQVLWTVDFFSARCGTDSCIIPSSDSIAVASIVYRPASQPRMCTTPLPHLLHLGASVALSVHTALRIRPTWLISCAGSAHCCYYQTLALQLCPHVYCVPSLEPALQLKIKDGRAVTLRRETPHRPDESYCDM